MQYSFAACSEHQPIDASWLARPATAVAPDLLGCILVRQCLEGPEQPVYRSLIVETEAYMPDDPAMHAYQRRTQRNAVLFGPAGLTYVYRIYGIYHCLNVVTDREGVASAVLIRALQLDALPPWVEPAQARLPHRVAAGPGKLCRALNIDVRLSAHCLQPGSALWLEHRSPALQAQIDRQQIRFVQTTRIGLTRGVELPWRWYIEGNRAVSVKAKS